MKPKCSSCGQPLPNDLYGSRCEDCWAIGAGYSSESGHVPFYEKVLMGYFQTRQEKGFWRERGRVVRK